MKDFVGIPNLPGGRTRKGADCVGVVALWYSEKLGLDLLVHGVTSKDGPRAGSFLTQKDKEKLNSLEPNDLICFANCAGEIVHVGVWTGSGLLHTVNGAQSRFDRDFRLMMRIGLTPAAAISPSDAMRISALLADPVLGEPVTIVLIVLAVVSIALSIALQPKLPKMLNRTGAYSSDGALLTLVNTTVPLPDLLGKVVVAGNLVYQTITDKAQTVTDATVQKVSRVVILGSGPMFDQLTDATCLKINGVAYGDAYFYNSGGQNGFYRGPVQTKAEAVDGTIGGNSNVPSISLYSGAYGTHVPVDVRAQFERSFPVYGFNGCGYLIARVINTAKMQGQFNVAACIKGRLCRQFDASGFVRATVSETISGVAAGSAVTANAGSDRISLAAHKLNDGDLVQFTAAAMPGGLTAATNYFVLNATANDFQVAVTDGGAPIDITTAGTTVVLSTYTKTRYKLGNGDVESVSSLSVNGVTHTEISATNQSGNVFFLNRTRGYVEFPTAPAAGATISINYTYFVRSWTQNPAALIVYLLTDGKMGLGFDESRIAWARAVEFATYCDEQVMWIDADGTNSGARWTANYVLDYRKPALEHIREILNASNGLLFLSSGQLVLKPLKAETSVFSFNPSNIMTESVGGGGDGMTQSTLKVSAVDRQERHNWVDVYYSSGDTLQAETGIIRDDPGDQRRRAGRVNLSGIVPQTLKFLAVDNANQAERLAETFLRSDVNRRWRAEWRTNLQGLALEPGDVVDLTHPSHPSWAGKLFRVESVGQDEDGHLTIRASEYFAGAFI